MGHQTIAPKDNRDMCAHSKHLLVHLSARANRLIVLVQRHLSL